MPRRLRFAVGCFVVLLLAVLYAKPAEAVPCNDKFCDIFKDCVPQTNGPNSWCFDEGSGCMWTGDCGVE